MTQIQRQPNPVHDRNSLQRHDLLQPIRRFLAQVLCPGHPPQALVLGGRRPTPFVCTRLGDARAYRLPESARTCASLPSPENLEASPPLATPRYRPVSPAPAPGIALRPRAPPLLAPAVRRTCPAPPLLVLSVDNSSSPHCAAAHLPPVVAPVRCRQPRPKAFTGLCLVVLVSWPLNRTLVLLVVWLEMSEAHEKDKQIGKEEEEEEEEHVLLELDYCLYSDISPGAPFVLSGLDAMTPTLTVGDGLEMLVPLGYIGLLFVVLTIDFFTKQKNLGEFGFIGEYEDTVGTCYLFSESETQPKPSNEMTTSGENKEKTSKEGPS